MIPVTGTVLDARYTLTWRIAAGGMGEVWAATDAVLDRPVAVKLLNPALSQQSNFVERFRAEARCSAALEHPNITTVFDYGEDDGSAYLVLELVTGQSLDEIISRRGPLSAQETVPILIQAARALEAAHRGGVIHRDVKPANILITPDGTAKLTDFGISRLVDTAPLTQPGEILGTAQYISPERVLGLAATAASDIYALGVVGHEMLTGRQPFSAETVMATALAHINEPPPPLPDSVPVGLRTVISAALAKEPGARPASAAAMAQALGMPDALRMPDALGMPGAVHASRALTDLTDLTERTDRTQVIPISILASSSVPSTSPGLRHRRSRSLRRPTILLGAAAAVAIGIVSAFALSGSSDVPQTPLVKSTNPTGTIPITRTIPITSATPSTIAATVAAPPADTSSIPERRNKPRDRNRGHDEKDGKK